MPRSPRVQYDGARYHIINRGNYRKDLFCYKKTDEAFEKVLFEACEKYGWLLHAYVLMSNHYHLCIETPNADLVDGMHWLQSTFANRFSKFSGERGHVFQGRYKALLIEDDYGFLAVVDYIHLNPVRAGLIKVDELKNYTNSSFPRYFSKYRPECLRCEEFLTEVGVNPTVGGMRGYHKHLKLIMAEKPKVREALFKDLTRGWFIGSKEGKQELVRRMEEKEMPLSEEEGIEVQKKRGMDLLSSGLVVLGKTNSDIMDDKKSEAWKLALASFLKEHTGLKNPELTRELNMGHPAALSGNVSRYRVTQKQRCKYLKKLIKILNKKG